MSRPTAAERPRFADQPRPAADKSPDAFRTISEVADDLDLPQHVLRFWETRFPQIKPLKRGGGRRYYRPDDVVLLRGIRHLLYGQGYTIKGVQRILKEEGPRFVQAIGRGDRTVDPPADAARDRPAPESGGAPAAAEPPAAVERSGSWTEPGALPSRTVMLLRAALAELLECDRVLATLADDPLFRDR